MECPISVEENERRMVQGARHMRWGGDIEEEEEESEAALAARVDRLLSSGHVTDGGEEHAVKEVREDLQRMRAALTRT